MNDEMKEALLIQCLDDLEAGMSITEILARHPESMAEIQPILTTARELMNLAQDPTPAAQNASHELFLAHAEAMRQVQHRQQPRVAWWRRLTVGFALVVLLLVGTVTAFDVSAAALPGDALYPVKRTGEALQLMLTQDEATITTLRERFQKERVSEIKTLLQLGREADVTCEGVVTAIDAQRWDVCNLQILVNQNTAINGKAQVGSRVKVIGVTRSQVFIATMIQVIDPGNPPPTPTPTQTPRPTVTKTAVPPTITPTQKPPSPTATSILEDDHPIDEGETEDDSINEPGDDSLTPEPSEDDASDDNEDIGSGSDASVDGNSSSDTQDDIGDDSSEGGEDNSNSDDAHDDGNSDDHEDDSENSEDEE